MEKLRVYLGGTRGTSTWRDELTRMIEPGGRVELFNPVVQEETEETKEEDLFHRRTDDVCLYVITPEEEGFDSFVEALNDSNKQPERTLVCFLNEANGKKFSGPALKSAYKTLKMIIKNHVYVAESLPEISFMLKHYQVPNPRKDPQYTKTIR